MRGLALTAAVVVMAACGGGSGSDAPLGSRADTSASQAAITATPRATTAPTAASTDSVTAHIETAVTVLATLSTDDDIRAWIEAESDWLDTQPTTERLRPYLVIIASALIDLAFEDESTDLQTTAAEVIQEARQVAGVDLSDVPDVPVPTTAPPKVPGTVALTDATGNSATVKVDKVGTYKTSYGVPCDLGKCLTIRVTITGTTGEDMEWAPFDFTIVSADGDTYEITGLYKDPSLPYDISLSKGEKVRGWLTFDVPKSLKHGRIHIGGDDGAEITF